MKRLLVVATAIVTAFAAQPARAGSQTTTISVGASVPTVCAAATTSALGFGALTVTSAATAQGTITLNCTAGGSVTVALNNGANANSGQNVMIGVNPAHTLNYFLYQDGGYSTAWVPASPLVVTGTGSAQVLQVYGKMLSGQSLTPDTYSDTVTVTITY